MMSKICFLLLAASAYVEYNLSECISFVTPVSGTTELTLSYCRIKFDMTLSWGAGDSTQNKEPPVEEFLVVLVITWFMSSVPSAGILTRNAEEEVKAEWARFVFFHRERSRDGYLLVCFAVWTNSSKLSREQKTSRHPINVRDWGIQVMLFVLWSAANCWCSFSNKSLPGN